MKETGKKAVMAAEVLLLLLPLTLFMALLVLLSYVAYPLPDLRLLQVLFDIGVLLTLAGIVAAWRLAFAYLRAGNRGIHNTHWVWMLFLAAAAIIGLLSTMVAIEQFAASDYPSERIGFTLLAPALALLPLSLHLLGEYSSPGAS